MTIKGTTSTGFKYEYNDKIPRSMRFLEDIVAIDQTEDSDKNLSGMSDLVTLLLGDKKEAFYKHLEKNDPDGIATIDACKKEITEMITKTDEGKN